MTCSAWFMVIQIPCSWLSDWHSSELSRHAPACWLGRGLLLSPGCMEGGDMVFVPGSKKRVEMCQASKRFAVLSEQCSSDE